MLKFKKTLASIIIIALFSVSALVSCGKQAQKEEAPAEVAADSTEHPADSTDHPSDSTEHPADKEHPADSTKK